MVKAPFRYKIPWPSWNILAAARARGGWPHVLPWPCACVVYAWGKFSAADSLAQRTNYIFTEITYFLVIFSGTPKKRAPGMQNCGFSIPGGQLGGARGARLKIRVKRRVRRRSARSAHQPKDRGSARSTHYPGVRGVRCARAARARKGFAYNADRIYAHDAGPSIRRE